MAALGNDTAFSSPHLTNEKTGLGRVNAFFKATELTELQFRLRLMDCKAGTQASLEENWGRTRDVEGVS